MPQHVSKQVLHCLVALVVGVAWVPAEDGWSAVYYEDVRLHGEPITGAVVPVLDLTWPGSPFEGVPEDFSARFAAVLTPPAADTYTFTVTSDDGVRIWFDGDLVHDHWWGQAPTETTFTVALDGSPIEVVVEYYDDHFGGRLLLEWETETTPRSLIDPAFVVATTVDVTHRSPSLIPVPDQGLRLHAPRRSRVSPVCVEGAVAGDEAVSLRAWSGRLRSYATTAIDAHHFYADIPLSASRPTVLLAQRGWRFRATAIRWVETKIEGDANYLIRQHDSMLLRAPVNGTIEVAGLYGGDHQSVTQVRRNRAQPVSFDEAGDHVVVAKDRAGRVRGRIVVTVVAAPERLLASEIGYPKVVHLPVEPRSDLMQVQPNDPSMVALSHVADDASGETGKQLVVQALQAGRPMIIKRLAGQQSILGLQEIDEFTLRSEMQKGHLIWRDADGVRHAAFAFTMDPVIPYLRIGVEFYVAQATIDGKSAFDVLAIELDEHGQWHGTVDMLGGGRWTCHRVTAFQDFDDPTEFGFAIERDDEGNLILPDLTKEEIMALAGQP